MIHYYIETIRKNYRDRCNDLFRVELSEIWIPPQRKEITTIRDINKKHLCNQIKMLGQSHAKFSFFIDSMYRSVNMEWIDRCLSNISSWIRRQLF